MRLLKNKEDGEVTIVSFDEDSIPPYAILSHTWGADTEEVTFADLEKGGGQAKSGYQKIKFCGEQASRDGLEHFWIDTCCINKTSKAELSYAIRSMFRWYRNAARCYVYLSDVSSLPLVTDRGHNFKWPIWIWMFPVVYRILCWCFITVQRFLYLQDISHSPKDSNNAYSQQADESKLQKSRWFTRGWTLQELLAPSVVEFFSKEGIMLGDKSSLVWELCEVTNIPIAALQGTTLSDFSVNERISWNEHRTTKIPADSAYCLMGILGVSLSPIDDESPTEAMKRVMDEVSKQNKCIQDLRSSNPRDDKKRIEETKGGLLADAYQWIFDNSTFQQWQQDPDSHLLWLKGDPGKGKTMLLCGIIDKLQSSMPTSTLLSYFFCQATDSNFNGATAVLRGLLYMLVLQQPALVSHVRKKHDYAGKALFEDANAWIALKEIFIDVLQDPCLSTTYLIIDALDECVTDLPKLLEFVAKQSTSGRVKWIVSSRNWPNIEAQLEPAEHKIRLSLELNAESVAAAVAVFIQHKVDHLAQEKQYKAEIRHAVLQHLMSNASDTFLWVALVCKQLESTKKWDVLKKIALFPPGLDSLYERMLNQISDSDNAEICQHVIASTAVLYRPVTIPELIALVQPLKDLADDLESVREIVSLCGSFLILREDTVYFVHQSAKDFLFAKALDKVFPHGIEDAHRIIFSQSLAILSSTLHRDMYGLEALGSPVDNVKPPDTDPLAVSCYPCIYWIDHLHDSKPKLLSNSVGDSKPKSSANSVDDLQVIGVVNEFLRKKYLYWLEGLSLCKSLEKGVVSMEKLWLLAQEMRDQDQFTQLIQDAWRFVMYHKGPIEGYPLQTYASALLFSPRGSLIRQQFQHEGPEGIMIKPAINDAWSACLQTLEGHNGPVRSVAFSHDSARLASASDDHTIKIWDTSSSACLQTLKGHSNYVWSVAFSHNSTRLASASGDCSIKIWDTSSGACLQTLKSYSSPVRSVVFSHDSTRLASALDNHTINIWDTSSGVCLQTIKGHSNYVWSVAFSHNSSCLASASDDRTIKIWDTSSSTCLQILEGHSSPVRFVAFSHNSTCLASASGDCTIKIWDTSSGTCLQTFKGHSNHVWSVTFSHNSTRLASASGDLTVKIWDTSSGACLQTLKAHSDYVRSVAFSHNSTRLASASDDRTIKIWDTSSSAYLQMLEGHSSPVRLVAFSRDSNCLASASDDRTVKIWDTSSGVCLQTLKGHNGYVQSVAFSYDSTCLALASDNRTVKIWDTSSGACLQTLKGHSGPVRSVAFSHNSTRLASASDDRTLKIWDTSSGVCLQTLKGHSKYVWSVAFSHDSTCLASVSGDRTVKIWDTSSGACLQTLNGHSGPVWSVAYSHDSTCLASASDDRTVKIWDTSSGTCLQTIKGHSDYIWSVAFSHNSTRLASASGDHTIKIWDMSSGACLQTLNSHSIGSVDLISILASLQSNITVTNPPQPVYQGTTISSDGTWIIDNGQNMLWLPTEYRPVCSAMSGRCVALGTGSGTVWIFRFK